MSTESPTDGGKEMLEANIRRTVAVSALRKIRGMVDEYEEEQRFARRYSRIFLASLGVFVLVAVVMVSIYGLAPIVRSIAAL